MLAVGHLIVLSVRRRARDLAVLRTLGCTPSQTKRIVAWQATMLATAGAVVGTLVLANVIAWWPGRRAANRSIVDVFRTE